MNSSYCECLDEERPQKPVAAQVDIYRYSDFTLENYGRPV